MKIINKVCVLFVALTAFTLTGCGSSGSNPAGVNNSNTGFSTITGTISGSERATVTFYTPEAVMKQKISEVKLSSRASLGNTEGVYSVETVNGRYSVDLPNNDYYVVVSGKDKDTNTGYAGTIRAAGSAKTQDFTLTKVFDVAGSVVSNNISTSKIIVSVANTPFIAITDENGNFTFNRLPVAAYTVIANGNVESVSYEGSVSITKEEVESGKLKESIDLKPSTSNMKTLKGNVYYGNSSSNSPASDIRVFAYSEAGEIFSAVTDSNGLYEMSVKEGNNYKVTANSGEYENVLADESKSIDFYLPGSTNKCILSITESNRENTAFNEKAYSMLHLYKIAGNIYEEILEEPVGLPLKDYKIGDLEPGNYIYMIESDDKTMVSYLVSSNIKLDGSKVFSAEESKDYVTFGGEAQPEVYVDDADGSYNVKNLIITKSGSIGAYICMNVCAESADEENEYDDELKQDDIFEDGSATIDTSFIEEPGEYQISVEYGVQISSTDINTQYLTTSISAPFVKHDSSDQQ